MIKKILQGVYGDASAQMLLLSNLVIVAIAGYQGWGAMTLLWVFWSQNICIGIFAYLRLRRSQLGEMISLNKKDVPVTDPLRRWLARFFCLHYGLFNFVYALFLINFTAGNEVKANWLGVAVSMVTFFFNHFYSYRKNVNDEKKDSFVKKMAFPYLRIIPMHVLIVMGGLLMNNRLLVVVFLLLKTTADLISHLAQHRRLEITWFTKLNQPPIFK